MKKLLMSVMILFVMMFTVNVGTVSATSNTATNNVAANNVAANNVATNKVSTNTNTNTVINPETQGELKEFKEKSTKEVQDYIERYGSDAYGITAYILDKIRIYSIPLCFVGIAVGAIYQYVIGIRKMDVRDRGFGVVIAFVTLLIICQILPLIFAIVVKGWR